MGYELGWQCPKCQAFHAQPECGHDQSRPCRYCTLPVGALSTGGPDVCSRCEVAGVPPDIYMGLKPARNFHAERARQELVDQAQELNMGYGPLNN